MHAVSSPPLALDLHYLLTVYGSDFWQAEALLGYALMMLHEAPVLTRQDIASAITMLTNPPPPLNPPYPANKLTSFLNTAGLADQIEMIKITPESMGREEMAWLWTALKADYRPTHSFQVSAVLMQPKLPTSFALPVLTTVFGARPMNPAQIGSVVPPAGRSQALPGETVTVNGAFLTGASQVVLTNARFGMRLTAAATATATSLTFQVPPDAANTYPVGMYDLAVQFLDAAGKITQTTNTLPLAIAANLPASQTATTVPTAGKLKVTIKGIAPAIWKGQSVSLGLSAQAAPFVTAQARAQPVSGAPVKALDFLFDATTPTGIDLLAVLQVDGVPSPVIVNPGVFPAPPTFGGPKVKL